VSELATRLAGSADLYEHNGRRPYSSINFVTSHDGFTLNDLVSYNDKHNEANGDHNTDGDNHNLSWNCGVEGPTDDPSINALRQRQRRNFIATLFLSQGVPMIAGGDEIGRTQRGNNNAYCQDNEISWTHWNLSDADRELFDFTCRAIAIMKEHPVLRRRTFLRGHRLKSTGEKDITWLAANGQEMTDAEWNAPHVKVLGAAFAGGDLGEVDPEGRPIVGEALTYLLNADADDVAFQLPSAHTATSWECLIDTADPAREHSVWSAGATYPLTSRSVAVFRPAREPATTTREARR
jgi:glycogen operon protein